MAVVVCLVLSLLNPAALAVHANVALAGSAQKPLDVNYLLGLGPDAVPALVDEFAALTASDQCTVATALITLRWDPLRYANEAQRDWRNWNASAHVAAAAVRANASLLQQAAQRSGDAWFNDTANFDRGRPGALEAAMVPGCQ